MLRVQAKQIGTSEPNGATIVTKAAKGIPKYPGTHIEIEFVNALKDSWQAHLEKISPFMIHGETVWWTETEVNTSLMMAWTHLITPYQNFTFVIAVYLMSKNEEFNVRNISLKVTYNCQHLQ